MNMTASAERWGGGGKEEKNNNKKNFTNVELPCRE